MGKRIVIEKGQRFGILEVIRESERRPQPSGQAPRRFELKCECGGTTVATIGNLRSGHTRSCGCLSIEAAESNRTTHGYRHHPAYTRWMYMRRRCNPNYEHARDYFERGITVCDEWKDSPVAFCNWSDDNGFSPELELDRRENDKGYSPENCRYITKLRNCRNTRSCYDWWVNGNRYETNDEAAAAIGVSASALRRWCIDPERSNYVRVKRYKESA